MSEKRFTFGAVSPNFAMIKDNGEPMDTEEVVDKLNEQQATILKLEEEKGYWKSKAMTLLMQVRRLIPRMSAKEVIEFGKELEDE